MQPEAKEATTTNEDPKGPSAGEDTATENKGKASEEPSADSMSVSSTESDDSNTDEQDASKKIKDPELLLVKATQLKEQGNTHFKENELEKAMRSYRRGISTLKPLNKANTGDPQVKALLVSLQSNLSMMYYKLKNYKQSATVATSVLKIEVNNVKALYRRAVANRALGEQKAARDDLKLALKLDEKNVAVKRELVSLKKIMEAQKKSERKSMQKAFSAGAGLLYDDKEEEKKQKAKELAMKKKQEEEAAKKRKAEWEDECVKRMARNEPAISFEEYEKEIKEKEEKKQADLKKKQDAERERRRKEREAMKDDDSNSDDELTEKELQQLRGYKKTKDGRITSYFTREQSQEEKLLSAKLNAPKKIDAGAQQSATTNPPDCCDKGNASAWNQAGTWEEKDTTDWCRDRLQQRLKQTKVEHGLVCGYVTATSDMNGDASVALVSGKKRFIFDFHCKITYEIRDRETEDVLAGGSMTLPDICSTHHEELEVAVDSWKKKPTDAALASECRDNLVSEIRESVRLWVQDFNSSY